MNRDTAPGLQSSPAAESWACTFSEATTPAVRPGARYRDRVPIGSGSMGRVEDAYDTLLRRHVALKVLRADAPHTSRDRFMREATITAGLEHPSIVTVHDSGTLEEGLPYYTMQLVRGHPWSPQEESSLNEGLARLAAVCEAVGHAHTHEIVHRDLKPANIMVSGFAAVVVVDWGLAVDLSQLEGTTPSSTGSSHGPVGTPLYMSPEQARGAPPRPSADVWALGMMLYELLAKAHPFAHLSTDAVVAHAIAAKLPDVPSGPPELVSILKRALESDAHARYASAIELAADLRTVLSGGRVAAHEYRARDLLHRFWQTYRLRVLAVLGVVTLLVATALYAAVDITRESRRARDAQHTAEEAERQAQALRASSEGLSKRLLAQQAQAAARAGRTAAAEHLAEAALRRGDSALSRGVLASTWFEASPRLRHESPAPCPGPLLSSRGERLACIEASGVRVLQVDDPKESVFVPLEDPATTAILEDSTGTIWVFDQARELLEFDRAGAPVSHRTIDVYDVYPSGSAIQIGNTLRVRWLLPDGSIRTPRPELDPLKLAATGYADEHTLVISTSGEAWLDGASSPIPPPNLASAVAVAGLDNGDFVVSRDDGLVSKLDVRSGTWSTSNPGRGRLTAVRNLGGRRVALSTERQSTLLWDPDAEDVLVELPRDWGDQTARRTDGTLVSVGRTVRAWAVPQKRSVASLRLDVGVSMATASPKSSMIAVARGDGTVEGWNGAQERAAWTTSVGSGVVKSVAFATDGSQLYAKTAASFGVAVLEPRTGTLLGTLEIEGGIAGGRRILALSDGSVWSTTYGPEAYYWGSASEPRSGRRLRVGLSADASTSERGHAAVFLEEKLFTVAWAKAGGVPSVEELGLLPQAIAVDVDDDGQHIVAGFPDRVSVLDLHLREQETWTELSAPVVDVSVRGDGSMVAAGLRDGTVIVWRSGVRDPIAHLRVHDGRVASVDFSGEQLISAGWDGVVRRWALEPLQLPASGLRRADSRWGPASAVVPFVDRDVLSNVGG